MNTNKDKIKVWMMAKFKFVPVIYTWDLEKIAPEYEMMASSAVRYARTISTEGAIIHPIDNGKENRHAYILKPEGQLRLPI